MLGTKLLPPVSIEVRRLLPSRWDMLAAVLVLGFIVVFAQASRTLLLPLTAITHNPLSLVAMGLAGIRAFTALRMLIAMVASLVFTFTYATLAAKSRARRSAAGPAARHSAVGADPRVSSRSRSCSSCRWRPGESLGAEFAAIFAIFTSQAWNMAFSFYQSLRTRAGGADEAGRVFRLTAWMRFWRMEVPFAMPPLIWNMMMSMSGGWFFVVASEAISVGNTTITLPGIGSYIALAIAQRNLARDRLGDRARCWS